jgi:hypothetical protein
MKPETKQSGSRLFQIVSWAREHIEFGDLLIYLYALVIARQYFWVIQNNALAWALSWLIAGSFWVIYLKTKPFRATRYGRAFWIAVVLPLFFFYLLRWPFPDLSFDVLNYRLLHAERTLRGPLFLPRDFFPTPAPYNPAPDTLTALFRLALGYRLGTIINFLALLWSAQIVEKLLRPFVTHAWLRALSVLLCLVAEHLLFEINTYMVDLLAVPLLLEATWLTLKTAAAENLSRSLFHIALLLGGAIALKLTNAAAAGPIVLFCVFQVVALKAHRSPKTFWRTVTVSLIAFMVPLAPFSFYLWRLTGSPVFPLANTFFKSVYWHTSGGWDMRWGPFGIWETVVWPVLITIEPARHSELAVYSGRLTIGFIVAIAGLVLVWRQPQVRKVCALFLVACLLWSVAALGYSRYGLYQELLAGVAVVGVISALMKTAPRARLYWPAIAAVLITFVFIAQVVLAFSYVLKYEWSMRPTALSNWSAYRYESRFAFRDRSLSDFLSADDRALFRNVPAWVESGIKSTGFEVLLDHQAPILSVNHAEYFSTDESRSRFVRAANNMRAPMLSLCFPDDLAQAKQFIKERGLEPGRLTPIEIPFFSQRNRIGMMLIEISPPQTSQDYQRSEPDRLLRNTRVSNEALLSARRKFLP